MKERFVKIFNNNKKQFFLRQKLFFDDKIFNGHAQPNLKLSGMELLKPLLIDSYAPIVEIPQKVLHQSILVYSLVQFSIFVCCGVCTVLVCTNVRSVFPAGGLVVGSSARAPTRRLCLYAAAKTWEGKGGGEVVRAEHLKINYKMWWKIVSYQLHLLWNVLNNQRSGSRHFFLNIIVNTTNYFPNLSYSVNNLFDASYSRFSHMSTFS